MDRTVLIVLLGIPVLVLLHAATFRAPLTNASSVSLSRDGLHARIRSTDRQRTREGSQPTRFVINPTNEQGS